MYKASSPPIPGYFSLPLGALGLMPARMYYFEAKCISQKTQAWCHFKVLFYIITQVFGPWCNVAATLLQPGLPCLGSQVALSSVCLPSMLGRLYSQTLTFRGCFALMAFLIPKIHFFHLRSGSLEAEPEMSCV